MGTAHKTRIPYHFAVADVGEDFQHSAVVLEGVQDGGQLAVDDVMYGRVAGW